jgi:23S rRNA pseudouridine1911/1915/1917 synthase
MKITIKEQDTTTRLDKLLSEKLPKISRSFIQKQIKDGSITLNGEQTNVKTKPSVGDEIVITKTEVDKPDIKPDSSVEFKVVEETDDYLIIDKPAGLVVHPAVGVNEPTLVNGLLAKYPELKEVGEDELRPGIVHRLDRDVSGLMIVARTQAMFDSLKKQFQERTITKIYTALVHGVIDDEDGTIDTPIGRSLSKSGKMATHPHSQKNEDDKSNDRDAITEFEVLDRIKNYTLLTVTIRTGRSHQIRVHLNSIQYPVVGDTLYTNKQVKQKDLGRIFLHSSKLGFENLGGEQKEYESKLPSDLQTFLKSI